MGIDDKDIIDAMKQCPDKGFRLLMKKYKEAIYWHIRRLVVSHADAQDATQETFVRVFRNYGQYDEIHSLTAWIFRIATNEALRLLERIRQEQLSLDVANPSIGGLLADSYVDYSDVESVRLQKAIQSLPSKQQITFNLRYYDELGYEEIAEVTDSTVAGAKMNYHLAKEKIIAYMNSQD